MGPKQTEQLKDRNSKVWKSIENYHSNSLSKDRYSNGKERHSIGIDTGPLPLL